MRTFIFFLCTTVFGLSSVHLESQNSKIVIERDQTVTVDEVFDIIREQTKDYMFIYKAELFKDFPKVQLNKGVIWMDALISKSLKGGDLDVILTANNTILIKKSSIFQSIKITGQVLDQTGLPIPGVTVLIKGTLKGVSTDFDGKYSIVVPSSENILVFSALGFKKKEVLVDNQNVINILLEEDIAELDAVELVSTGYQTISKERSAGSYSKPDMDVFQNRSSSMNVAERLDGLVPGLTVNRSPGAELFNPILVRGLSTLQLTQTSPLIVVDGIPIADIAPQSTSAIALSGLLNINPQDIKDITVLKDATAASIWGARAANGVIVINTKKGNSTGETEFQYDTFVSTEGRSDLDYLRTLESKDFIQVVEDIFDPVRNPYNSVTGFTTSGNGIPPHERILYDEYRGVISSGAARRSLDSLASINNRDQIEKIWYRPSILTTHTLSVSGGADKYSFYASGNYTGTQSHTPGEKDNRYKLNFRQNFDVGKRVNIDLITDITYQDKFSPNNINIDSRFLPYQLFRDANGNNIEMSYMTELNDSIRSVMEDASRINLSYTPLNEIDYAYTKSNTKSIRNILGFDADIVKGLKFQGKYGYTVNIVDNESYTDHLAIGERTELVEFTVVPSAGSAPVYYLPSTGGKYATRGTDVKAWTIRNQLSYIKDWNNRKHQLNLIAGQEAQEQLSIVKTSQVRGYDDRLQTYEQIDYGNLARVDNVVKPNAYNFPLYGLVFSSLNQERYFGRGETISRFTSYYGNVAYTYNQKYSLNASVRNDQSNLFGLDKSAQNKPVWSVGGRWDLGRETFLKNSGWLNMLALRATYGIAGNAPRPGSAASFDILTPTSSFFFPETGLRISTPGNRKLSWERTATKNFGIDFNFIGRISGSIDYYQRRTEDLLGTIPTNPLTGYSSVTGNLGDIENDGVEMSLQTRNIVLKDFSWTSTLNIAYNKNTLTKLNLTEETTSGDVRVREQFVVGYPTFGLFAYDYVGLDENGDPQIRLADGTITKDPNVTTPEDIKFMGTTQPKWNGGFGNTFAYKNLSLNINTVYSFGHVMRRDVNNFYSGTRLLPGNFNFLSGNINEDFLNRWQQSGDENTTDIPRHVVAEDGTRYTNYYVYGNSNVISGSFIKIRDINLVYRLPSKIFGNISWINQVTVRGQVSNILLWADNDYGIDPEYHFFDGSRALKPGERITLGLNVKF
ncbi:SusC/RagA family TonB-linked outer membrane protein [Aestuariibaculum suncheonense]|uniref:SusC/RagA family TonB-linked outer membrane protein n=1 Tax=Aestuariibaculum suncheonense TaxID=1028745 RepID=A0A8J6QI31_9FLAO|nr:SusC/RagA family TonB-linked outer membrane protein [Aestuariibaculum suncheonense]MBD0836082.1 SusC/RagA family TonB-linked outer membrane protein [Aestuariibaculum suncheonense]